VQDCRRRRRRQGRIRATHTLAPSLSLLCSELGCHPAQVVVLCLGTTSQNDEGNAVAHEGTDRGDFTLPASQAELARAIFAHAQTQHCRVLPTLEKEVS